MSLFSALTIAVEGLNAQSASINNVSNNVANADTIGFKSTDTSFESLVTGTGSVQSGGGVVTSNAANNTVQGTLESSSSNTSLAISGQGFFAVQTGATNADGTDSVNGDTEYTREGDYSMNADGYLVNASGDYLMGYAVNSLGVADSSKLIPVQVSEAEDAPVPTTSVDYAANLPSSGTTSDSYPSSTLQIYDSLGNAHDIQFQWTNTGTDTWQLKLTSTDPTDTSGDTLDETLNFVFNDGTNGTAGTLESITPVSGGTGASDVTVASTSASNEAADVSMGLDFAGAGSQNITFNFGDYGSSSGVTQYSGTTVDVTSATQNGVTPGSYSSLSIDTSGNVVVNYSNGQTKTVYQVPIATFNAPDSLEANSGGTYSQTLASGSAKYSEANTSGAGEIESGELEDSNVDIADQFSTMIKAQQIYSANSKTITTANQMLSDLLNVVS